MSDEQIISPGCAAEEEPQVSRRQKPVEIRKRNFNRKAWPLYPPVLEESSPAVVMGFGSLQRQFTFCIRPKRMRRARDQIDDSGKRFVSSDAIVEKFSADMHHSVVRVPLGDAARPGIVGLEWNTPCAARVAEPHLRGGNRPHASRIPARGE